MNNYDFLNITNAQIVMPKDLPNTELNGKYMLCLSGFVGYHNNLACAIFIKISNKLKQESNNNGLYELILNFTKDLSYVFKGNDNFALGKDYYISESLYDFLINLPVIDPDSPDNPDNPDDSSDSAGSSDDSSNSSHDDSSHSSSGGNVIPSYVLPPGIVIIGGPDVNYTLSLTKENRALMEQLYGEQMQNAAKSRKTVLTKAAPYIPQEIIDEYLNDLNESIDFNIEDGLSDEEQDIIEGIIRQEYILPDYIRYYSDFTITQNFDNYEDLSELKNKDFSNITNFDNINSSINNTYTKEELENLPKSFFTIILEHAVAQNYYENINNQIYHAVMKYWQNGGFDEASNNIALILGTMYATSTTTTCGCNGINKTDTSTESCKDMYANAMIEWLSKMLSDIEYYYDWFFIPGTGECPDVNVGMIDMLITLLREFINEGRDLSFSNSRAHCECPNVDYDNGACNYAILENYIKVLNWVKQNNIEANSNKIKVYGTQFAELLPKLVF